MSVSDHNLRNLVVKGHQDGRCLEEVYSTEFLKEAKLSTLTLLKEITDVKSFALLFHVSYYLYVVPEGKILIKLLKGTVLKTGQ